MIEQTKITLSASILSEHILEMISKELDLQKQDDYYDFNYDLIIRVNPLELNEHDLNKINIPIYRKEYEASSQLEKVEWKLRGVSDSILHCIEDCYFSINQVYFTTSDVKNSEILLIKKEPYSKKKRKNISRKIHVFVKVPDIGTIHKIFDSIEYPESNFFIDERNNNKTFFNKLLLQQYNHTLKTIDKLNMQDWKQLVFKEKITTQELAMLYSTTKKEVIQQRKKFISNMKQFHDEYILYFHMFVQLSLPDYYSNFSIIYLEQMQDKNIETIYHYSGETYQEWFSVSEELTRQKAIEKNNLMGKDYVIPLSGILLKKMYDIIKNELLDRKILKSGWFMNYYGKSFLTTWLKEIEKSHILEDYETGKIYQNSSFLPYPKLYEKCGLKEKNSPDNLSLPTLVPTNATIAHTPKKIARKICPPKDYILMTKIKRKVGKWGEKMVYDYEMNELKNYKELQKKIEKTYLIDDAAGYDIKSYDYDGNPIYIEVKTSKSSKNNQILFYISRNEDQFISSHKNAYIYYIYDLKAPKLRIINQETYLSFKREVSHYQIHQEVL